MEYFQLPNGEFVSQDVYQKHMNIKVHNSPIIPQPSTINPVLIVKTAEGDIKKLREQAKSLGIKSWHLLSKEKLIEKMSLINK